MEFLRQNRPLKFRNFHSVSTVHTTISKFNLKKGPFFRQINLGQSTEKSREIIGKGTNKLS